MNSTIFNTVVRSLRFGDEWGLRRIDDADALVDVGLRLLGDELGLLVLVHRLGELHVGAFDGGRQLIDGDLLVERAITTQCRFGVLADVVRERRASGLQLALVTVEAILEDGLGGLRLRQLDVDHLVDVACRSSTARAVATAPHRSWWHSRSAVRRRPGRW